VSGGGGGDPLYKMHFVMDAPLSIRAVLYVPKFNQEKLGFGLREESRVSLYSRKVLISQKQSKLLPEYLRFVCVRALGARPGAPRSDE
jgi:TNF receptor-associated protein 1